jgi:putative DNA primase/helicase
MSLREQEAAFRARVRNNGRPDELRMLPAPNEPMKAARMVAAECFQHEDGTPILRHWRGGWWEWRQSHWVETEPAAARAAIYEFTEDAFYATDKDIAPWAPNRHKVANLLEALAAIVHLPEGAAQPAWIDGRESGVIVATANGLLDVGRRELLPHTPLFFNVTAVPFAYDPTRRGRSAGSGSSATSGATTPSRWSRCRSGSAT